MPDTTICVFCESGDHEHPAYDARVMRCGCSCHVPSKVVVPENGTPVPLRDAD